MPQPANFEEYPKMVYHSSKGPRVVKSQEEETTLTGQGFTTKAPSQFEDESAGEDPTREPAIVSQIEQEKTRLAGNQGAKDPAQLLADEENGDENSEDATPKPPAPVGSKKGSTK